MATIRAYTTIEQSKKLAEILPLKSADMRYDGVLQELRIPKVSYNGLGTPCWSLAALLSVLPDYTLQTNMDGTVFMVCESKKPMISDTYDNPVDACVAMIKRLHKLNLL